MLTFLVLNVADTKQKLGNDVFQAAGVAQKYNCSLVRLDYQQEQGLVSSLPLGINQIKIQRSLTTSNVAVFVPFVTQELFQSGAAMYYGINAKSHNMIMLDRKQARCPNGLKLGTPGSGKSMLAKRLPSILPPLTLGESLETTKIHSVAGKLEQESGLISKRPFRAPHHTISTVAMTGGGSFPQPGEISLAHNGVLFLDELPEFNRNVLEVLRQPLEDREISISRIKCNVKYPASLILAASMNPCPCGYYNHPTKACVCSPGQVQKYLNRISGPLLDRIDLQIEVIPVPFEKMSDARPGESSTLIRERVVRARQTQSERYAEIPGVYCNAQMNSKLLARYARPDDKGLALLKTAMNRFNLSARAYDRILKVSRTIADLEGCELIQPSHLAEAIGYRNLDREDWAG